MTTPTATKNGELLERLARGDDSAIAELYAAYADQLLSYGTGLGFGREQLKDAIHDLFWKLCASRGTVADVRHLKAYLFRALKNRLLNSAKVQARNAALDGPVHHPRQLLSVDTLIEEEDRNAVASRIEGYLARLTGRQREAVYLHFIEEMDYTDIAALLEITPHGARKLVSRAITSIRESNVLALLIFSAHVGVHLNQPV